MNLRFQTYCEDILSAIDAIPLHLQGLTTLDEFSRNLTARRAVERELEITGEATNRLLSEFPDTAIPDGKRIIGMRNRIMHGYASVDVSLVWSVTKTNLPTLREIIKRLKEEDENS